MKYTLLGIAIAFFVVGFYTARIYYKCEEVKQYVIAKPYKPNYNKIDSSKQMEIKIREDIGKIVLVPTPKLKKEIKDTKTINTSLTPLIARLTEQIDKRDSIIDLQNKEIANQQFQLAEAFSKIDTLQQKLDSCGLDYNNLYSESRNKDEKIAKLEQSNKNNKWGYGMGGSLLGIFVTGLAKIFINKP